MSGQRQIGIDFFSASVSLLQMSFNDTKLSIGTCFFWERGGIVYLVTNWHNVSGKNPLTGKHLSPSAAEPNRLTFDIWENRALNSRGHAWQNLDDANGPTWLEHPQHGNSVDVVCLPLQDDISKHVFPINSRQFHNIRTRVSDDVFIIGFPLGANVERLPVWKRGSIASEPDMDVDKLPKFYVDTASSSGMSGSPVLRRESNGVMTDDGSYQLMMEPVHRLIGVYSGRLQMNNSLEAQLGIVWKVSVIDEIISGGKRGAR